MANFMGTRVRGSAAAKTPEQLSAAGRKPLAEPTVALQIRIPKAHDDVIEQRGKDWLRAVIARAVAELQ